ncbi:MAG: helix-turn-helix domain-containing protein [Gammaproteobacteria bacterium]
MPIKPETSYPAVLGSVLARQRKQRGWDQKTLAERLEVSISTWSRIENGESNLSIPQLQKVADILSAKGATITSQDILEETDRAVKALEKEGVVVHPEHKPEGWGTAAKWAGLAILSAAALGGFLAALSIDEKDK